MKCYTKAIRQLIELIIPTCIKTLLRQNNMLLANVGLVSLIDFYYL